MRIGSIIAAALATGVVAFVASKRNPASRAKTPLPPTGKPPVTAPTPKPGEIGAGGASVWHAWRIVGDNYTYLSSYSKIPDLIGGIERDFQLRRSPRGDYLVTATARGNDIAVVDSDKNLPVYYVWSWDDAAGWTDKSKAYAGVQQAAYELFVSKPNTYHWLQLVNL